MQYLEDAQQQEEPSTDYMPFTIHVLAIDLKADSSCLETATYAFFFPLIKPSTHLPPSPLRFSVCADVEQEYAVTTRGSHVDVVSHVQRGG